MSSVRSAAERASLRAASLPPAPRRWRSSSTLERCQEELRAGRTRGASMEAGVHRAWPAIRDSNISTLITCFVLYFFGAPLIKGFAITLAIGVMVSMFSAIVTTQQFLQILAGLRPARRLALYGVQAPKAA